MKGFSLAAVAWMLVLSPSISALAQPSAGAPPAAVSGSAQTARSSAPPPLPPISEPPSAATAPAATAPEQPSAAGSASASFRARRAIDTEVPPALEAEAGAEPLADPALDEALRWRAQNTLLGPTGGLRVVDGASGPPGTARLQFGIDYFSADEYLFVLDHDESLGGVLSL